MKNLNTDKAAASLATAQRATVDSDRAGHAAEAMEHAKVAFHVARGYGPNDTMGVPYGDNDAAKIYEVAKKIHDVATKPFKATSGSIIETSFGKVYVEGGSYGGFGGTQAHRTWTLTGIHAKDAEHFDHRGAWRRASQEAHDEAMKHTAVAFMAKSFHGNKAEG